MSVGSEGAPSGKPLRVPAWKRIGLKLKYARDTADDQQSQSESRPSPSKNVHRNDDGVTALRSDGHSTPPKKRRKTVDDESRDTRSSVKTDHTVRGAVSSTEQTSNDRHGSRHGGQVVSQQSSVKQDESSDAADLTEPKSRRKSVTFTPETKREDGFSAATLGRQWNEDHFAEEDDPQPDQSESPIPKKSKSKSKKEKPSRKPSGESKSSDNEPPAQTRVTTTKISESSSAAPFVQYLQQFHHDKSNWKFNKVKQNEILKHTFDIKQIPSEYNDALVAYLSGLQGAAAQRRLIDTAIEILDELINEDGHTGSLKEMESEEARRKAYGDAYQAFVKKQDGAKSRRNEYDEEQLEAMERKRQRCARAIELLPELLSREFPAPQLPLDATSTQSEKDAPPVKRKNRKSRTQNSSSSNSSSSDDDDNTGKTCKQSDSSHLSRGPTTVSDALRDTSRPSMYKGPAPPTHGPAASGAIPAGFQIGGSANNQRKKIFDDELLDRKFGKKYNS